MVLQKLSQIEFIVLQSSYPSEIMKYAKVVLPSAVWYEKSGAMVNTQGHKQSLKPVFPLPDSMKEDWQVFAELCNRLSLNPISISLADIQKEMYGKLADYAGTVEPIHADTLPFQCISFMEEGK